MSLAFAADELLQKLYSKKQIKFLYVMNPLVREAIKRRGECWRISPLPRSPEEMARMITSSRIGIGGRPIYYYNAVTGTRLLTYQEFCNLGKLDLAERRQHLIEIRDYSAQTNRTRNPGDRIFHGRCRRHPVDACRAGFFGDGRINAPERIRDHLPSLSRIGAD